MAGREGKLTERGGGERGETDRNGVARREGQTDRKGWRGERGKLTERGGGERGGN